MSTMQDDKPAEPPPFCPPESRKFVLISAILASSMGFIDGTVVAIAIPAIRADLGASLVDAQWITNSYMLMLSAFVLTGGAAADVFGVRNLFAAGVGLFVATSLLCAFAPDDNILIAMRAAQGLGAALMVPASLAIIAKSYPNKIRGQAIGTWAAFSSITTAFGPIIGSLILSYGDAWAWRLIFAINVPIGLVVLFMLFTRISRDRTERGRRLDLPGALLATLSLGSVAWGLTIMGMESSSYLASPFVWLASGLVLAFVFFRWEKRAVQPMVKLELFRSNAFAGANFYTLLLFVAFNAVIFYLPMTLIAGWGTIEWQASLMFAPLSVFIGGLSRFSGRFADRHGPQLPLVVGAICIGFSYLGLAATMPMMQLWSVTFPIMCLNGIGMGILVSPLSTAVMQAAPDEDAGLASGINNAIARSAGLLAVAAFGALAAVVYLFASKAETGLEFGAVVPDGVTETVAVMHSSSMNMAFQAIALMCALLSFGAAVAAWRTQQPWASGSTGSPP